MKSTSFGERIFSALCYLPFFAFLSLILAKKKKSCALLSFHVKQGLILFAAELCLYVPLFVLARVLADFWYVLGTVTYILIFLLTLVFLFLCICGISFSLCAKMKQLPIFAFKNTD